MKTAPANSYSISGVTVILIATIMVAAVPHLSADIILVSRYSDAQAYATSLTVDWPPARVRTDFSSGHLSNSAAAKATKGGFGAQATTNTTSAIVVDHSMGTMQVTGDCRVDVIAWVEQGYAEGGTNLIVLTFTLTESSYRYSLSGALAPGGGGSVLGLPPVLAKLATATSTIFEVLPTNDVILSETGTLPPGTYTLSIQICQSVETFDFPYEIIVSGNFDFELTPAPPAQTVNLSTRLSVQSGENVGVAGFIITGTDPKQVLLRGLGPSLSQVGIGNSLSDPQLELNGPHGLNVTNNNWKDTEQQAIEATGLAPTNDLESAILMTLSPGAYTTVLRGHDGGSGVALVEVYDLDQNASKLANLSTRAFVGTGNEIVIAGLILGNNVGNGTIAVRSLGPSLASVGIASPVADPILQLRDSNGVAIAGNNDWMDYPPQAQELMALGLAPTDPRESGIVRTLSPGLYTALLSGVNNEMGVGLIEVYDQGSPAH